MSKKKPLTPELQAECLAANELFLAKKNELKLTQKKIADAAGISPAAVAQYLNGTNPLNAKFAATLSRLIGEPVEKFSKRLADEIADIAKVVEPARHTQAAEPGNVTPAQQPDRLYRYPVISRVAAGAWQEAIETCDPWAYDTFELADYQAKGPAFWLHVSGDSMTSPVPPSIPEGHLILVDTGIEPRPGDMVVAKLVDADEATFKLLVADAGQLYLKPLNPAYRMIPIDERCRLIGVVVEAKMKLRR